MKVDLSTPPEYQRQTIPEMEPRGDYDAVLVSAIITVLFHVLVFLFLPQQTAAVTHAKPAPTTYEVKFESGETVTLENIKMPKPQLIPMPEPPPPERFVETNPEAPQNVPDEQINFGARDQQSAQPEPAITMSPDRTPETRGPVDNSNKIIEGTLADASDSPPEPGIYSAANQAEAKAQGDDSDGEQLVIGAPAPSTALPAPKALKAEATNGDGLASYLDPGEGEKFTDKPDPDQPIQLSVNETTAQMMRGNRGQDAQDRVAQRAKPLPRPRLVPRMAPGPLRENPMGVSQTGVIAIDANFSEHGEYMQRMIDAISMHWHGLNNDATRSYAEMRSHVCVEFTIRKDGSIRNVSTISTTADRLRTLFCEEAIKSRAPYGEWAKDMISKLGDEETIRFNFYYY
ncbi:MAG: hypothetical protein SFY80_17775 [Verrucomicrobiota bacterium]|nr:hypothetical protein [Verrucomicrobiota bacterium]